MKNLKRALSLVLSAAMMVGMMVVGTSAASFKDVDATDNLEAIEVMKMIGVMEGVDEDNFAPDRAVTRNEMAVVICNLMDLKLNGFHPFTDVPAWADPYVGAMYINGLTSGTSATTYGGSANVTTTEAALMILKTLGYFEYQVEFEDDWALATIKRATLENLFEKVSAGVKETLTRGEVAQMVLNALDNQVVLAHDNSSNISVEGNGMNVNVTNNHYYYDDVKNDDGSYQELKDKLFDGKLNKTEKNGEDAFGRPSVIWTYTGNGKTEKVTAPKAATTVWTAEVTKDAMTKLLKDYEKDSSIAVYVDGKQGSNIDKSGVYGLTANGRTVELYTDSKTNKITHVIAINEYADKVYSVTKADEDTGAKRYVTVDGMKFETEDFAKKDRVVFTKAYDKTEDGKDIYVIKSMKDAEFVEGKITGLVYGTDAEGKKFVKSAQIDGVTYKLNPTLTLSSTVKVGSTVKMVLDTNGNLLWTDTAKAAAPSVDEYVIVTAKGEDGFENVQYKALKTDGTTVVVGFEQYTDEDNDANNSEKTIEVGKMYSMEDADNDGKYEFYKPETSKAADEKYAGFDAVVAAEENKDEVSLDKKNDVLDNGWEIADEAIVFTHKLDKNGKDVWGVTTGAKLAAANEADVNYAYANKGDAGFMVVELAFVESKLESSSDALYGYVVADPMEVKNADNETVAQITFWNGEENVTLLTDKANANKLAKKAFFTYVLNADGAMSEIKGLASAAVTGYNGTKIALAKADLSAIGTFEMDDDAVIIYVDADAVKGADDGEIEIADKNADEDAYILNVKYALNDDGKVCVLFVDVLNNIFPA